MSDPTPILRFMGIGDADEETEPQSAAGTDATASTDATEGESLTIEEALAALDGQTAPQETQPAEPVTDPSAALTAEQIAAILAENDQFKADKAKATAEQAVEDFETQWGDFYWDTVDVYDKAEEWIRAKGAEQGRSQAEIDAVVYQRVVLGNGLTIPGTNTPMMGKAAWERDTLLKYANAKSQFLVAQGQSSVDPIAQIAQAHNLDATDTQSLAAFRDLPREKVEAIAQALGAKNQRTANLQTQVVQEANQNVARHLANATHPGAPGAPAAKKPYVFRHTPDVAHQEAQLIAGIFRRTG